MRLRDFLDRERLSVRAFAQRVRVTEAAMSRYVSGKRVPRSAILERIAKASGGAVRANDFFADAGGVGAAGAGDAGTGKPAFALHDAAGDEVARGARAGGDGTVRTTKTREAKPGEAPPGPTDDPAAFRAAWPAIETVDAIIVDMCGIARGKRLAIDALPKVMGGGVVIPGSTYVMDVLGNNVDGTGMGPENGDPDYPLVPVPGTLAPVPWAASPRAQVLMTMIGPDGRPYPFDPRVLLAGVAAKLKALKLKAVVALELEFYLLDRERGPDGAPRIAAVGGRRPTETQVYSLEELDAIQPVLDDVAAACAAQGIPSDVASAEYAPGQYEINLHHVDDPVAAADHAVLLKRAIKGVADRHGYVATFMAKPFIDLPGNGTHLHVSLWDEKGRNVFDDGTAMGSDTLRHAIGGLAATMGEAMAIFAPNANAYRRIRPGAWVPLAPTWGYNNRTVAVRIPAAKGAAMRLEHRVAGADANPYLVAAAVLAGVHHGIVNRIDPGPALEGNVYDQVPASLPATWGGALDAFEAARVLPGYLGAEYARVYALCKRHELATFNARITPTEYDWYMKLV